MDEKNIRVRLDLPKKLYHEARAEVERRKALNDREVKNLSDLVALSLRKMIRGDQDV